MQDANKDPIKKYWWLILVVLPIVLSLIALIPNFLNNETSHQSDNAVSSGLIKKSKNTSQSTVTGDNFSHVQGNINITESSQNN